MILNFGKYADSLTCKLNVFTVFRRDRALSVQIVSLDTDLFKSRRLSVVNNKIIGKGFGKVKQIITMIV